METYSLTPEESASLRDLVAKAVPDYDVRGYECFRASCESAVKLLPESVLMWANGAHSQRIGLLRNLPIDAVLPPTPTERYGADRWSMFSDKVVAVISTLFGTLYTIQGKGSGRHIGNIFPLVSDEFTQLASSSRVGLAWHTEEAFHPARPSWLGLLCLRGERTAVTRLARACDLDVSAQVLQALIQPRFKLKIDETYSLGGADTCVTTALLSDSQGDREIILDPAYTVVQSEEDSMAIAAVETAADDAQQSIVLSPGDYLVFDNRRVIHARSDFEARGNGIDRWLKRCFMLSDEKWLATLRNGVVDFQPPQSVQV